MCNRTAELRAYGKYFIYENQGISVKLYSVAREVLQDFVVFIILDTL